MIIEWWFTSWVTSIIAYVVGFVIMLVLASTVAPWIAKRVSNRFSLKTSMVILGGITIIAGISGIAITGFILAEFLGAELTSSLILWMVVFVIVMNFITYLLSPYLINLMYGARRDEQLQKVVNEVASKLGIKNPPKAVVVRGPPNAFAYGNFLTGRYVAVTTEMLNLVDENELKAVVGHELGHHIHRDNAIMLFMGIIPSVLYFLGVTLIRIGILSSVARLSRDRESRGGGGIFFILAGFIAIIVSFIVQIIVLAFSRLREYYADSAGAMATSPRAMQRALARLHIYYSRFNIAREFVANSKMKTLFLYALTETITNPFYSYSRGFKDSSTVDIDSVIDELKRQDTGGVQEFLSSHPPIPKRIRFLDSITGPAQ